ncbi:Transcriptional regulatory protein OmpR [Stenotrophomonas lactitubi]|nr:Transcriptional regulatory protein OmpR [Stenotrophomonas lactitubi]CAH0259193.1 Transcriptional regulatory protein OmpR [Stenotrophomonas lactitubi]CAH0260733.1 Transcriptional regulatory protein OmpR [Stenotrophomonas lactitubi]CAH0273628.1 Transcriptional regulatory protein OmpR [Stenotrophomonas lactitubi]
MPGEDGLSVCRRLQARAIPILMLSAMGSVSDRVIGLEVGADDYLAKPFDPRELLARVRALLRRQEKVQVQAVLELRFAGWRLLPEQRRLLAPDGSDVILSRGEFTLLQALAERTGRVLGREQLMQLVNGDNSDSVDRAIDLAISRLRRKLEQAARGGESLILTLRGDGYRFGPTVERL